MEKSINYEEKILLDLLGIQYITDKNQLLLLNLYIKLLHEQQELSSSITSNPNQTIHISIEDIKLLLLNSPTITIENGNISYQYKEHLSSQELITIKALIKVSSYQADFLTEEELNILSSFFGKGTIWNIIYSNFSRGLEIPSQSINKLLTLFHKQLPITKNISLFEELIRKYTKSPEDKTLILIPKED